MLKHLNIRNKFYLIVVIVIGLGLLSGFIFYNSIDNGIKENIIITLKNLTNYRYNFILKDLIIMSMLLVFSFLLVGAPLGIFYLFFEGFSISFLISIFIAAFKIKGFMFIIIYIIFNKLIVLLLIIVFIKKIVGITKNIASYMLYKKDKIIVEKTITNFKNCIYIIIFALIINIILFFVSPIVLDYFLFLLK